MKSMGPGPGSDQAVPGGYGPASTTYLVTGGAGFIGSHLTDRLIANGDRVIVLDDLSGGSRGNLDRHAIASGRVRFVHGSVLDAELVDRCTQEADVCVHLAAALGVQRIVDNPLETLLANVRGADIVMEAAHRHRRIARKRLHAGRQSRHHHRTVLQRRRFAAEQRLRHGPSALRGAGARGRGPDHLWRR